MLREIVTPIAKCVRYESTGSSQCRRHARASMERRTKPPAKWTGQVQAQPQYASCVERQSSVTGRASSFALWRFHIDNKCFLTT
eukprot:178194-Pleurochrysis_carterae.AAC.1